MPQTSASVATNDVVRASDHNTCVADIASLFTSTGDASTSTKGRVKLNVAPSSPTNPVAIASEASAVSTTHLATNAATDGFGVSTTATFQTASLTLVDVTGMSGTVTVSGTSDKIFVVVSIWNISRTSIHVNINGVDYPLWHWDLGTLYPWASTFCLTGLAAGTYTVKLRAKSTSNPNTCTLSADSGNPMRMSVICLKR